MTMQEKTLSFEQLPGLIQNLVERIESLEKTVRDPQKATENPTKIDEKISEAFISLPRFFVVSVLLLYQSY